MSTSPFPANPIPNPRTDVGKQALKLYEAAVTAGQRVSEAREAGFEAVQNLQAAETAFQSEVHRGAVHGRDPAKEAKLAEKHVAAKLLAEPGTLNGRHKVAQGAQRAAVVEWQRFVYSHFGELIAGEFEDDAIAVSEDFKTVLETVQPVEIAYWQVAQRVDDLVGARNAVLPPDDPQRLAWKFAGAPEVALPPEHLWRVKSAA